MNKTLLASALLLALSPAHAITNGEHFNEPAFVQVSGLKSCSGTVIAGKWVISAAHCQEFPEGMVGALVRNTDGVRSSVSSVSKHPGRTFGNGGSSREFDIVLFELSSTMPSSFMINPNQPNQGDVEQIAGFSSWHGGNLKRTNTKAFGLELVGEPQEEVAGSYRLLSDKRIEGEGWSEPGDSGGACYNKQGVWGVIMGAALLDNYENLQQELIWQNGCNGIFHPDTKAWLLESINSWSHATVVKGSGNLTVQVQSLHQAPEVLNPVAEGGLQLVSNSCERDQVQPFGRCEVVVNGAGQLRIGEGVIEVNAKEEVPPQPEGNGGGGDSGGGAAGWLALLGLGALVARRRRG